MKVIGIIPARFASTRFPGKPLVDIHGISMIERVYRRAMECSALDFVVVATDDARIFDSVISFGGEVVMTSSDHVSGTDRCAEAFRMLSGSFDVAINIQGDEPFIQPEQISLLVDLFSDPFVEIATLIKKVESRDELLNINIPKVVVAENGDALYFSRHPVPFNKDKPVDEWLKLHTYFKHIGIYGYRSEVLPRLTQLPRGVLEIAESLEQLRWLENGFRIRTGITDMETIAIDTPDDLARALERLKMD